ncbi:MAG: 6-bladed beta-propeller [Halanaerobiales bacterium]|nr:6-bladed beta-propeller [Halanaerobiales bacterium]
MINKEIFFESNSEQRMNLKPNYAIVKYETDTIGDELGLKSPKGIAVDSSENIYIADSKNNRIVVLNGAGEYIRKIGQTGNRNAEFIKPLGITIKNDKLYVSDAGNKRIQILRILYL